MPRLYKRIATILLLVTLLSGCQSLFGRSSEGEAATPTPIPTAIVPENPTYIVQRGQVVKDLQFTGRVSPVEEVSLHFKASGYVKRVLVERGDQVKAGDLLAELEIDDLLKQMAQAEVALNTAQLRLNEAQKELERQIVYADLNLAAAQIRATQAQDANADAVIQAELALAIAREQLAKLEIRPADLAAEGTTARVALEQAGDTLSDAQTEYQEALDREWEREEVVDAYARALKRAQQNHRIAQARYAQALAAQEAHQLDLTIQRLSVDRAAAQLAQLQRGVDPLLALEVQRAQQERDWLEEGVDPVLVNQVDQARLSLERLQAQVADAQIAAPIDGVVLSLSAYPGLPAEAYEAVVIVADPQAIELSAVLSESQLEELVEGQKATVSISAFPDQNWTGVVRRLPYPYGAGGGSQGLADEDKSARISMGGDLSSLERGDLAHVVIVLEEKEGVLWLPPEAIRTFQGRKFVIVQEETRQRRVDVKIGIESRERVEILEGLQEDQIVVGQ